MIEQDDIIYRRLQEHMHRMPVGFPQNESGLDIRILKNLFTVEEAQVALELGMLPETVDRIYPRIKDLGYSKQQAGDILDSMLMKGLLLGGDFYPKKKGKKQYSTAQWAIGVFEFQGGLIKKEIAPAIDEYFMRTFRNEFFKNNTPAQLRTIPIERSIRIENKTATYDNVRSLVKKADDTIVLNTCICRETKDKIGTPCKKSEIRETCIFLGPAARWAIETRHGRVTTKDEILSLLDMYEQVGFVIQTENSRDPQFICCCCGCCCDTLGMAKHYPRPTEIYSSNYYAVVDREKCGGTGECMSRCQMGAIVVRDGRAVVNTDRCIGCGLCTSTCRSGALALHGRKKKKVPPKTHDALYQQILIKKLGPVKAVGVVIKNKLGFKV